MTLTYTEKQEFILKIRIETLQESIELIRKELKMYPESVRAQSVYALEQKIKAYKTELENLYTQDKLFN